MKNICNSFLSALVVATISIACHKDEQIKKPCDSDKGTVLTDQTGRIYRWTRSEPNFFYIGNVQPVTTGVNGGYICSISGTVTGNRQDGTAFSENFDYEYSLAQLQYFGQVPGTDQSYFNRFDMNQQSQVTLPCQIINKNTSTENVAPFAGGYFGFFSLKNLVPQIFL